MIRSLRHRGLKRLFSEGDPSRVRQDLVERVSEILAHLDQAKAIRELNLPGFRLHPLKGKMLGKWSITVSGNWRITFRLGDGDVFDVDLVDYH